ncbi:MAG TPA: peptidylprolyl isomerase [Candidatus Angelobacter sp.]
MIRFLQSGNKAAKYLLSVFLLIICLGMVIYLIPGFMSGTEATQTGVVATVGGEKIQTQEVAKMVQQQMRGQRLPEGFAGFIAQRAVQSLIQRAEIRYEAKRMGLSVSDEEIRNEMRNGRYREIFFPDGKWMGQEKYDELMRQNNMTVEEFERGLRDDLLQRKLFNTVTAGVSVNPTEVEQAYKEQNTKVKYQYALLDVAALAKEIKPTEAELRAYYEANTARYQNSIPEKREVRYFVLSDKEAESKVTVSDSEVQRYYSSHQDDYRIPDRAKVRHIMIKTPLPGAEGKVDQKAVDEARAKAEDVLKQVKAGGNFAELAKKYSDDPGSAQKGGDLGWIMKGQMVAEFEKIAFSQSPGEISSLVQTSYGLHIVQTQEKETARLKPVSEVKPDIEKMLKTQKTGAILSQQSNDALDVAQKQGMDKAAAKAGAQLVQSGPVPRGGLIPGVGSAPELMNMVFTATEKAGPQLAHAPQGYVVFEVTKVQPPRTAPFEDIRERVANEFKNERSADLLRKKTQQLADRAHAQHDLPKAAKELGATVKTSELVGRDSQVPEIGSMTGPAGVAFTMKPGEISGPLNTGQKGLVLALVERTEPSAADEQFAKEKDRLLERLAEQKRNQALELFMSNLSKRMEDQHKIEINKSEMNNLAKGRG